MMSHYLNLLAGLSIASTLAGQPAFQWVKTFDGYNALSQIDTKETCIDTSGNVYTSGVFRNTFDFDPGQGTYTLQGSGWSHAFVTKLNASGDFKWARCFSGTGGSGCAGICTDAEENVFLTGSYSGTVDFDPGPGSYLSTTPGNYGDNLDNYIVKLDAQGNFVWVKFMSGGPNQAGADAIRDIAVDASGNCYVTGISTITQPSVIFTTKYDGQGSLIWMKQIDRGNSSATSTAIHLDLFGNVCIAGVFSSVIDFDSGPGTFTLASANGSNDVFILKLDGAGNFVWVKQLGGNCTDVCENISTDASGNIYTVGNSTVPTSCSGDFDPGPDGYTIQFHAFFSKLDPAGNFVWAKGLVAITPTNPNFGGPGIYFPPNCMALDRNANIYVSGGRYGPVDFDPGPGVYNIPYLPGEGYFLKLDSAGNFVWAFPIQFSPFSLTVNGKNGDIYSSGMYGNDFDPGPATYILNPSPYRSAFVHKLSYSAGVMGIDDYALPSRHLNLFPNPNNGRFMLSGNIKRSSKYQLIDALGRELKTATFENGSVLDFSDLNLFKGLYLLRVYEDDKWSQIPFLIE